MWCAHSTEFQSSTTEEDPLPFGTSFGGPSFATRYRADVHKILASEDQTPSLAFDDEQSPAMASSQQLPVLSLGSKQMIEMDYVSHCR